MTAVAVALGVALIIDQRQLLGVPLWEKPLKFAISIAIFSLTWSWLIGQLKRFGRLAWWAGTLSVVLLLVEMVIIVWAAAVGTTSHFNVSTPLHTVLWAVMAFSISTVWVATFVVGALLFRTALGDPARTLAIRAAVVISLAGMGLAFLMTGPSSDQISNYQGIVGAHTVGLADGGPSLPLLGWSTVAGDLRIPHFVGMHALQAIPLVLVAIELLSRRAPRLRDAGVRLRLVLITAIAYAALLAVLTWQALRGQSIVHPDALTLTVSSAIVLAALAAAVATITRRPVAALEPVPVLRS
jgi:hypothetical protein